MTKKTPDCIHWTLFLTFAAIGSLILASLPSRPALGAPAGTTQGSCATTTSGGSVTAGPAVGQGCSSIPTGSLVGSPSGVAWSYTDACATSFRIQHGGATTYLGDGVNSCASGGNACSTNADCASGNCTNSLCTYVGIGAIPTTTTAFDGLSATGIWTIDQVTNCKLSCNASSSVGFFLYFLPPAALTVSPTSLSFNSWVNAVPASQTITVKNTGGQSLSWTLSSSDPAVTGTPSSGSNLAAGASTTVTVAVPTMSTAGTRSATLTVAAGTAGTQQVSVTYSASIPPDFTIAVSPSSRSVLQGQSVAYTVTTSPVTGTDSIALSVSGLPSGVSGSFYPSIITSNATSTMTVAASNSAPASSGTLTVVGSGVYTHTATASLTVMDCGFTLSPTPTSATGRTVSFTVAVGSTNGCAGPVTVSVDSICPLAPGICPSGTIPQGIAVYYAYPGGTQGTAPLAASTGGSVVVTFYRSTAPADTYYPRIVGGPASTTVTWTAVCGFTAVCAPGKIWDDASCTCTT